MNKKIVWRGTVLAVLLAVMAFFVLTSRAPLADGAPSVPSREMVDAAERKVSIPQSPQRILALGEFELDALLALGIEPVGATNGRGQSGMPHYLQSHLHHKNAEVLSVGGFAQPNMDKVLAAKPDLILTDLRDQQIIAKLQRIAPTVVAVKTGSDWKSAFNQIAAVLGKEAQAQQFLAQYQTRVAALRQKIKPDQTVSIVRWNPKGPGYMFKDAFSSLIVQDLGLKRPAGQMGPGTNHSKPLSLEVLSEIDADWMFIGTLSPEGEAAETLKAVQTAPAFKNLKVVKTQQVRIIDGSLWTSTGGPLAALAVLDDLEKNLLPAAN
ncbi:iron-siderophore ABC transporter substrate-binding protein [Chitinibacter sp. SCUT-21]|uniref:ABC transporter substrate-binding protein n=1 Tax=Chitinibacter sp. SCUT-21 TaxID=2970891 RepID=UPI0035A5BC13